MTTDPPASQDPFSDESDWLKPEWISALLDKIGERRADSGAQAAEAQAELTARVQLHVGAKALLLQQQIAADQLAMSKRLGDQADTTGRQLARATRWLAVATIGLFIATVVLVIVTAVKHGG
jgi:hypothetical protein